MEDQELNDFIDKVAKSRGLLINEIIRLERLMDMYLAIQFNSEEDKARELMELIFCTERMTFSALFFFKERIKYCYFHLSHFIYDYILCLNFGQSLLM